jgi:alkylation response protein AidB-like acyl-CoA dehydrogenase
MNYDLDKIQKMLKKETRRFLMNECPAEFVRKMADDKIGYSKDLWEKMADMGWMGIMIPKQYEGGEGSFLDLATLLSEMGYACFQSPFFTTVVMGALAVLESANDEQKAQILPAVSRGELRISVAWVEADGAYFPDSVNLSADVDGDKYVLNGQKLFVPYAHVADCFICVCRTGPAPVDGEDGLSLFWVDAGTEGIHIAPMVTMAGDKQSAVTFDNVVVAKDRIIGQPGAMWPILEKLLLKSAVAKCAEMIGGARRAMEMATGYAKGREQFGRPIGAFQSIQHHCADILTCVDTMTFITNKTAWLISEGMPFEKQASMCKAWVSEAYRKVVGLAHQVVGGFGFMEEYDLQLYFKHAKVSEHFFGNADFHRELVARKMGF